MKLKRLRCGWIPKRRRGRWLNQERDWDEFDIANIGGPVDAEDKAVSGQSTAAFPQARS
jgi:hypothetical protein